MASSVSSSTSLQPKKRKLSNCTSQTTEPNEPGKAESSIDSMLLNTTTAATATAITSLRKASHDSTIVGSANSEDAEALATLPSLGSFSSCASKGLLKLPEPIQQQSNLPQIPKLDGEGVVLSAATTATNEALSIDPHPDVATKASATTNLNLNNLAAHTTASICALDHLDALGDDCGSVCASKSGFLLKDPPLPPPPPQQLPQFQVTPLGGDDNSSGTTLGSANHWLLLEALKMSSNTTSNGRDRLESWGGMSDLSMTGVGSSDMGAAALAASALHHTGIIDDITAAANFDCSNSVASSVSEEQKPSAVPSRISLGDGVVGGGRDRKWSVASLSEVSASGGVPFLSEAADFSTDVQAFVAAATLADRLSELAGAVEAAASSTDSVTYQLMREAGITSDASSAASPLIGAMNDCLSLSGLESKNRSRSSTIVSFSQHIAVDYDAVAAAVDAAEAATCAMDLTAIASIVPSSDMTTLSDTKHSGRGLKRRRQLPLNKKRSKSMSDSSEDHQPPPVPSSSSTERDLEAIRARARAAAGYVPPSEMVPPPEGSTTPPPRPPFKKRAKRQSPEPDLQTSTPKLSNTTANKQLFESVAAAATTMTDESQAADLNGASGPANLKWEEMFQTLLGFIDERREEETKCLSEEDKANWCWDGNVPTNFRTSDGKALGRWINNQRSAKSKGALKSDRENRLVNTGLRWSVLTSNSWNKMLEELRVYAEEQSKNGEKWDGNVPTNYVLPKGRATEFDEDKNLGRWVNRQRCLFQSGKLKGDRREALENIGLKWSMLATTSWDEMYESLREYAKSKTQGTQVWDGNVPANHRTNDKPPRSLGRWINRQRSAYTKNKLKKEYVDKLSRLGLKWAIHERKIPVTVSPTSNGGADAAATATKTDDNNTKVEAAAAAPASKTEEVPAAATKTDDNNIKEEAPAAAATTKADDNSIKEEAPAAATKTDDNIKEAPAAPAPVATKTDGNNTKEEAAVATKTDGNNIKDEAAAAVATKTDGNNIKEAAAAAVTKTDDNNIKEAAAAAAVATKTDGNNINEEAAKEPVEKVQEKG